MKINTLWLVIAACIMLVSCGNGKDNGKSTAKLNATITVADSVDATGNYSGIQLLIINQNPGSEVIDTLFISKTDSSGFISGEVKVPKQGLYPILISRRGVNLLYAQVILAANDTLTISGELPGITNNFKVDSREERAVKVYTRVDTGFNRVLNFMRSGAIADSLIADEIFKWSNLLWDVYEEHPGTIAATLGAKESIRILKGFDNDLMQKRLNETLTSDQMIVYAADFGKAFHAEVHGLEASIAYLDSLKGLTKSPEIIQALDKVIVESYYDSSKTDKAQELLNRFKIQYKKDEKALEWAEKVDYDLTYLSEGKSIPDFSFVSMAGDSISNKSLIGQTYVLEVSPVTNQMYKDQFDRSVIIKQIYQGQNLGFYTIPLEVSAITVGAFFDEQENPWPVARPGSFDTNEIVKVLNVSRVPTRFLVDEDGKIERKYVGDDFDDVLKGLNKIFNRKNQEN